MPYKNDYFRCIERLLQLEFSHNLLTSFAPNATLNWGKYKDQLLFDEMKEIGVTH
jgi:hypothetical protein